MISLVFHVQQSVYTKSHEKQKKTQYLSGSQAEILYIKARSVAKLVQADRKAYLNNHSLHTLGSRKSSYNYTVLKLCRYYFGWWAHASQAWLALLFIIIRQTFWKRYLGSLCVHSKREILFYTFLLISASIFCRINNLRTIVYPRHNTTMHQS